MFKVNNLKIIIVSEDDEFLNIYKEVAGNLKMKIMDGNTLEDVIELLKSFRFEETFPSDFILLIDKKMESAIETIKSFNRKVNIIVMEKSLNPVTTLTNMLYENLWVSFKRHNEFLWSYSPWAFNKRLIQLRKYRGYSSAAEVAKCLGINEKLYESWENNVQYPDLEQMTLILNFFDMDPNYFFLAATSIGDWDLKKEPD